ncbi:unnamed protein product [Lymnaea stagnalis]|uniref:Uncharacterized protein n=1 Tax=Lymnaea stagnalis TaxID=6523 RepID=A0AAV2H9X2_LYMST
MENNNKNNKVSDEKPNGLNNQDKVLGQNFSLDESLTALLASTLIASEPDDINDIEEIAGEYSVLNNTIDELNSYLDRWDQRHDLLRAQIKEVLKENQEEERVKSEESGHENSVVTKSKKDDSSSSEKCCGGKQDSE